MEQETNWRYSGGAELIVLNPDLDFSNCIIFNLDKMIQDNVIVHMGEIFEHLIRHAKEYNNLHSLLAKKVAKSFANATMDGLISLLPPSLKTFFETLVKGRHYLLKDISKPPIHHI